MDACAQNAGIELKTNMVRLDRTGATILLSALVCLAAASCEDHVAQEPETTQDLVSSEERPREPTLPLPDVTSETSHLPDLPQYWHWSSIRAWHYNPNIVQPLWDVWVALEEPPLTLRMKVMLAAVTDSRNRCPYCLSSAVCLLAAEGLSEDQILALQRDIAESTFSEKEKTLLTLAEEITVNPWAAHSRVGPALETGWSEDEVAQAIFVSAYFNMLNRIAESFAFPPDDDHPFRTSPRFPMTRCQAL